MKKLSFIPEIFIWLAFSVVAGFGYAFSFFEYVESKVHMSVVDIVVPTLVWMLLAAICTFLLRTAQNTKCFVHFSKAESLFLECSILALLLIGGWVFRFVDYFHGVWPMDLENTYFRYAQVSQNMEAYLNPHPASRLYVAFLHIICLFLGNIYEIGAFIQFLLLLAAVVVWYSAIRKALGVITALFFVAGAMLLPDSIVTSMQCNPMMLLFVIYGCIALLIVHYAYSRGSGFFIHFGEVVLGILAISAVLLDVSGWLMLVALILATGFRQKKDKQQGNKKFILSFVFVCLGLVVGEKSFAIIQAEIYGMSMSAAESFQAYPHMSWVIPEIEEVRKFIFSLGTHPIFIVAIVVISIYWFLNKKLAFTWIMLSVLYLFALQLLKLDTYLQHDFMIYMGISVLFGISIQQYLLPERANAGGVYMEGNPAVKELGKTHMKEDPVVTVVRFEDQPAVMVPEKPLIFIPKTMEIPKRVSKPKVDFAVEVEADKMHYDYAVEDTADFDV